MRGTLTKASNAMTFVVGLTATLMLSGCASLIPTAKAVCVAQKPKLTSLQTTASGGITMDRSDAAKLLNYINDLEACTNAG